MIAAVDKYLRLIRWNKPIGSFLILWPVLTAIWAAGTSRPHALVLVVFVIGTFVMRSVGCIINDIADRHWDKDVERTAARPITAGEISVKQALALCFVLCLFALGLVLLLDPLVLYVAVVAIVLTAIYPFLKRFTNLPQVGLGVVFNLGIPMAYAAEQGGIPAIAWVLFVSFALITIAYDTMYGLVDIEDDLQVGIKSTAILFGRAVNVIIAVLQLVALLLLYVFGQYYRLNIWFYIGLIITLGFFVYQQYLIRARERNLCFKAFLNNNYALLVVFIGTVLGFCR